MSWKPATFSWPCPFFMAAAFIDWTSPIEWLFAFSLSAFELSPRLWKP
jgi:hypothetical protein